MAPPKGNKFAVGHGYGAEKKYDRNEYALKLIEWAKKENSLNVSQFAAEYDLSLEYISRWNKDSDVFRQALEAAKAKLIMRQQTLVHKGAYDYRDYNRQLGYYNFLVREFDREEKEFEAQLKHKYGDRSPEGTQEDKIDQTLELAKVKAENALLKEKLNESKTGTIDISSDKTSEHMVRSGSEREDLQQHLQTD